jgi:hypothetical protein
MLCGAEGHQPLKFFVGDRKLSSTFAGLGPTPALDYVSRRFNASLAGLKKPVGLDLRWDTALRDFQNPTGAPSQPKWGWKSLARGWFPGPRGTGLQLIQTIQPEQEQEKETRKKNDHENKIN